MGKAFVYKINFKKYLN